MAFLLPAGFLLSLPPTRHRRLHQPFPDSGEASLVANARINVRVEQVCNQVEQQEQERDDKDHRLNRRVVAARSSLDEQRTHPRLVENILYHDWIPVVTIIGLEAGSLLGGTG